MAQHIMASEGDVNMLTNFYAMFKLNMSESECLSNALPKSTQPVKS